MGAWINDAPFFLPYSITIKDFACILWLCFSENGLHKLATWFIHYGRIHAVGVQLWLSTALACDALRRLIFMDVQFQLECSVWVWNVSSWRALRLFWNVRRFVCKMPLGWCQRQLVRGYELRGCSWSSGRCCASWEGAFCSGRSLCVVAMRYGVRCRGAGRCASLVQRVWVPASM